MYILYSGIPASSIIEAPAINKKKYDGLSKDNEYKISPILTHIPKYLGFFRVRCWSCLSIFGL